ncbi:MAG: hypothetical protein AAF479_07720 [Pseudomonadota bacterium]
MSSEARYGQPPVDMGLFDIETGEMMFYLYLPVKMPNFADAYPERLKPFWSIYTAVSTSDYVKPWHIYIYMTVKTLWVEPGSPGNRPGWHIDGYGSNGDLNFIWSDMNPTEFAVQPFHDIPDDDFESMAEITRQVDPSKIVTYPDKHLLMLDESVVHRVAETVTAGVRTFVKVSVSEHRYNLKGNSHNYLIPYSWEMHDRSDVRNLDNKDFVK